jgi:hypothetical protein
MRKSIRNKIALAALIIGASSSHAAAMSIIQSPVASAMENLPIVKVHSLHNSCMYDSVTPSGTGTPKAWHRTAEAGVHTSCTPTRKPGIGKLKLKPSGGNAQSLQLSQ